MSAYIISFLNQKGGCGKSTLARLAAVEFARMDDASWEVKIADLDIGQGTSFRWQQKRARLEQQPSVRVEALSVSKAVKDAAHYHVMILDGPASASAVTREAALASHLVVLPSGLGTDDLDPTVMLHHELRSAGMDMSRVIAVLMRTGKSEPEEREARAYLIKAGLNVAGPTLSEQTMYRRASDIGCAVSETRNRGLNEKAQAVFQAMIDPIMNQTNNTTESAA